jgi:MFS family permease
MSQTSVELLPTASGTEVASTIQLRALPQQGDSCAQENVAADNGLENNISYPDLSRAKSAVVIVTASSMMLMNSILTGILTVGLPVIADHIKLDESLLLWPASVYGLTCGCTLLLSGSIADLVGSRSTYLAGCGLLTAFTLGCGLAQTGIQLIAFRAISGIAMSLCLPSAVSIITTTFATGKRRNIAFACLGAAQPFGFSLGIVLGGVLIATIGWRYGYYIIAVINLLILGVACFQIPPDPRNAGKSLTLHRLRTEIDWLGTFLVSTSLALFSYVLACMSISIQEMLTPVNIVLLVLAACFLASFILWINHRDRHGRTAMIPPSLFKSDPTTAPRRARNFSTICIAVFLTWAVFNGYQYFTTLYFQRVQGLSALQASMRFIPMVISGAVTNIATGLLVTRVRANVLCVAAATISACPPLLMGLAKPEWSYWAAPFIATTLIPISADTLFTISNLVITSTFPVKTQGLAGGVFNTISQIGMSVGLGVNAVISAGVASKRGHPAGEVAALVGLLEGYRAAYFTCFGASLVVLGSSWWGLRSIGKIGIKRD